MIFINRDFFNQWHTHRNLVNVDFKDNRCNPNLRPDFICDVYDSVSDESFEYRFEQDVYEHLMGECTYLYVHKRVVRLSFPKYCLFLTMLYEYLIKQFLYNVMKTINVFLKLSVMEYA